MAPTLTASYFVESPAAPGGSGDTLTLVTPSFSPAANEIIVVKAQTWDKATASGTPSGGSLTYTQRVTIAPAVFATYGTIFTASTGGSPPGSMTVTLSAPAGNSYHSMVVERWSSAQLAASPATSSGNYSGASAPSLTITTAANNSVVSWLNGDAQSVSPAGATYLSSATQDGLANGSGAANSVQYYAYQSAATAGSQTYGMSAPNTQKWAMAAIEIQDAGGTAAPGPQTLVVPQAAVMQAATW